MNRFPLQFPHQQHTPSLINIKTLSLSTTQPSSHLPQAAEQRCEAMARDLNQYAAASCARDDDGAVCVGVFDSSGCVLATRAKCCHQHSL